MPEIFDYPVLPETPFLEELVEELEGAFHVIAYAGHEQNLPYIKRCQNQIRERYGKYLVHVLSDVGVFKVIPAYDAFQELLEGDPEPDEIRQRCLDCLADYLTAQDPSDEALGAFQEFYSGGKGKRIRKSRQAFPGQ